MTTSRKTESARHASMHGPAVRALRRRDEVLRVIIRRVGPCRLEPERGHFITLCKSIISQQVSVHAARTVFLRFRALFKPQRPTPERVRAASDEDLRAVGLSRQKMAYLRDLANRFADGTLVSRRLSRMDDESVIAALTIVKGIGEWTAHMFLIFVLNRPDVWPVGDLGVRRAVGKHFGPLAQSTTEQLVDLAEPWRPYRTVAAWYLWRSLDLPDETA